MPCRPHVPWATRGRGSMMRRVGVSHEGQLMTRPLTSLALLLVIAGAGAAGTTVPRYQFEPGQEITYRSTSTFTYGTKEADRERGTQTDWTVWVVRPNADGSFRLVIRQHDS